MYEIVEDEQKLSVYIKNLIFKILFSVFFSLLSRYVPPMDSEYYEGTGYSKVVIDKKYPILFISMSIYSRSENGLLLYIGSEVSYLSAFGTSWILYLLMHFF